MPLSNCERCRKMFNKVSTSICSECLPEEEADIHKVREVIEREPNLTPDRAAELAGVDVGVVHRMVEVGVIARVDPNEKISCGKCGAPAISASKRLCQACLDRLNLEVAQAQFNMRKAPELVPSDGDRGPSGMSVRRKIDGGWRR